MTFFMQTYFLKNKFVNGRVKITEIFRMTKMNSLEIRQKQINGTNRDCN